VEKKDNAPFLCKKGLKETLHRRIGLSTIYVLSTSRRSWSAVRSSGGKGSPRTSSSSAGRRVTIPAPHPPKHTRTHRASEAPMVLRMDAGKFPEARRSRPLRRNVSGKPWVPPYQLAPLCARRPSGASAKLASGSSPGGDSRRAGRASRSGRAGTPRQEN